MGTTAELLKAAKTYVLAGRCVGAQARNAEDVAIDPTSDAATSFSIYGALIRAVYDLRSSEGFDQALVLLGVGTLQDPNGAGLARLEDDQLSDRFDEAIARAEGGPVTARSEEAEIRMLNPLDDDYAEKVAALRAEIRGTPAEESEDAPEPGPKAESPQDSP